MAKKRAEKRVTASLFYDDVVRVLGEMSEFEAFVEVPSKAVIQQILEERGLDETAHGESSSRKDRKPRVVLMIEWAFRNQRETHRKKNVYCKQGRKRGMWSLTERGAKHARQLAQKAAHKRGGGGTGGSGEPVTVAPDSVADTTDNVVPLEATDNKTAQFLADAKNWNWAYEGLCKSLARKLPRSQELNLVEDHVMEYLANAIAKDNLRRYLERGDLTITKLGWFAYRRAVSQFKKWGTEPLARAGYGAHTETEIGHGSKRAKDKPLERDAAGPDALFFFMPAKGGNSNLLNDNTSVANCPFVYRTDPEREILDAECADKFLTRIEDVLRETASSEERGEQMCHLFRGLYDQRGVTELAREMNMVRSTVSNRVQSLKRTLLKARDRGDFQDYLSR
jgi:hypothetical protein